MNGNAPSYRLDGKSAVVTGAGGGVGRGLAWALAAAGALVIATGRRLETVEETAALGAQQGEIIPVECDVTDRAAVERAVHVAVQAAGGLDVMVHNAVDGSTGEPMQVESVTAAQWHAQASVALRGSFHCAQVAYPHLKDRRGSYVLLTSMNAVLGSPILPIYSAVKGAQRGFAKSLAREWGPSGVRVNCIMPFARTPALDTFFAADDANEQRLMSRTPLGRVGEPDVDIGPVIAFLASDAGSYVSGQTIAVDGGQFTGL